MRIGEVARSAGISTRMLRHYDAVGLVRPGRSAQGYRDYLPEDVRRLFQVESLRTLGLPLRSIAALIDDGGRAPAELVAQLLERTRERIAHEQRLLARLQQVSLGDPPGWAEVHDLLGLLRDLESPDASRRQRAALAGPGGRAPVGVLVEALLAEDDPHVAGALQWAVAGSGVDPLPDLARALESADHRARRRAVEVLARTSGEQAGALLSRAAGDGDPVVRGRATLALGRRGSSAAAPGLVELVVAGQDDVVAAEVLGSLAGGEPDGDRIAGMLVAELDAAGHDGAVRARLAQALAEIPGAAAERALEELAAHEDRVVALTARAVLASRGP